MSTASGPSIGPLSVNKVFEWPFDFDFLIKKARYELKMAMTDNIHYFFPNAMNLSVTIHAVTDYLWHTKAFKNPLWPKQENFVQWFMNEDKYLAAFIDISNTYKHTERRKPNRFVEKLSFQIFPDEWIASRSPGELNNQILAPIEKAGVDAGHMSLWPMLSISGANFYFYYSAESALYWLETYNLSTVS